MENSAKTPLIRRFSLLLPDAKPLSFGSFREELLEQIGAWKGARHHGEELWESDEQKSGDDLTTVVKLKIHPTEKHALSRICPVLKFGRMANLTMKAEIDHGRITVAEPEKLPVTGKALLTVLDSSEHQPDWDKVMGLLGTMQHKVDGLKVEREARNEWDERERKQWDNG